MYYISNKSYEQSYIGTITLQERTYQVGDLIVLMGKGRYVQTAFSEAAGLNLSGDVMGAYYKPPTGLLQPLETYVYFSGKWTRVL